MKTLKVSKKKKLNTFKKIRLCKKNKTPKNKLQDCNELLKIILLTPESHIGSKSEKIRLIKNHFTKKQIIDVLKSTKVTLFGPIKDENDYEIFIENVLLRIQTNRKLPLF
tara:strand:- start:539 stop:868 length:330 start_codon:yes stop_codon:yes gene_type:complete